MADPGRDAGPPEPPALRSAVDISGALIIARAESAVANDGDGPYGELMANYAEWGELLEEWNSGRCPLSEEEFEEACRDHLERAVVLGEAHEQYWEQRWVARLTSRSPRFGGGVAR